MLSPSEFIAEAKQRTAFKGARHKKRKATSTAGELLQGKKWKMNVVDASTGASNGLVSIATLMQESREDLILPSEAEALHGTGQGESSICRDGVQQERRQKPEGIGHDGGESEAPSGKTFTCARASGSRNDDTGILRCPVKEIQSLVPLKQPDPLCTTELLAKVEKERLRSQKRVELIKKLRRLRAASTQRSGGSLAINERNASESMRNQCSSEASKVCHYEQEHAHVPRHNENTQIQTKAPLTSNCIADQIAPNDQDTIFMYKNKANGLLIELAKAKSEILTLRSRLAASEKPSQVCGAELERLRILIDEKQGKDTSGIQMSPAKIASAWRPFWLRTKEVKVTRQQCSGLPSQDSVTCKRESKENSSCKEKYHKTFRKESKQSQSSAFVKATAAWKARANRMHNEQATRGQAKTESSKSLACNNSDGLLMQLMSVVSSLSIDSDLSLKLDLKRESKGWQIEAAKVEHSEAEG